MADWDIEPSDLIREIYEDDFGKIFRSLGLDGLAGVIERTPVDTGYARGSWFVTINQASESVRNAPDKNGASTVNAGSAVIAQAVLGDIIVLQNNADYAVLLDEGPLPYDRFKTGQAAPAAMVDGTLQQLANTFGQ